MQLEFKHPLVSIGKKIDNFEVKELVGAGGMGWVYLAEDVIHNERVALKVLSPKYERNVASIRKFLHEASLSLDLRHPNIIPTIKYGNKEGISYLAIKYVKGKTVEQHIEEDGYFSELESLKIMHNVASALKYAWDNHHILHRDIKPGNIMLENKTNKAYLFDLGIALNIKETMSKDKDVEGSPYYISPEQARNVPLTFASDMYSLGITLYQMLTGEVPFYHKDIYKVIEMHLSMPLPLLKSKGIKCSQGTEILLRRMTAKKPTDRFHSWNDVLAVIEHIINSLEKKKKVLRVPFSNFSTAKKVVGLASLVIVSFAISIIIVSFVVPIVESLNKNAELAFNNAFIASDNGEDLLYTYKLHKKAFDLSESFFVYPEIRRRIQKSSGNYINNFAEKEKKEFEFKELAAKAESVLSAKGTLMLTGDSQKHKENIANLNNLLSNTLPQTKKSIERKKLLVYELDQMVIILHERD
ncbi:serine/threonine-protein kinase [Lentisphaerota bacterium WC36G]|nr:serine/threonine protein kinase [Lentisphaerae bacterium WC36]